LSGVCGGGERDVAVKKFFFVGSLSGIVGVVGDVGKDILNRFFEG